MFMQVFIVQYIQFSCYLLGRIPCALKYYSKVPGQMLCANIYSNCIIVEKFKFKANILQIKPQKDKEKCKVVCICLKLTCLYPSHLSQWTDLFSPFPSLFLFPVLALALALAHGCWLSCFFQCLRFWATVAVWGKMAGCVGVCSRCRGGGRQTWAVLLAPPWCQTYCWTLEGRGRQAWDPL